ncbi:diguanylate cyclase [Desulfopila sp. IMCC35006]|nr:diguanylate cyclase [Desulfopila sp. IMCC35006]
MSDARQVTLLVLTDRSHRWDSSISLLPAPEVVGCEFNPSIFEYSGVVLDIKSKDLKKDLLFRLRSHLQFCLQPIFLTESISIPADAVADGIVADINEAYALAQPICLRINSLGYDPLSVLPSPLFKVLLYLYVRGTDISPVKDWNSPAIYSYPFVALLIGFSEQVEDWLEAQNQRLLLEKGVLVDRLRRCPHCGLANPNYVDVCTNCRSIHIHQDLFLHCFTCGAVQPEKVFRTQTGQLVCPQCNARLRHIGTDYDRPIENYTCSDCHSSFSEPLIVAACPRCERVTETEDLEVKNYTTYHLTEKAVIAAKTGRIEEPSALLDSLQNVNFTYFTYIFNWLFSMAKRYKDGEFTVFAIRATNFEEIEGAVGIARLLELIEEYVKRVKSQLRTTDLTSLGEKDDIWFLLPRTNVQERQIVIDRILASTTDTSQKEDRNILDLRVVAVTIPGESDQHDTPEKIIAMIRQELNRN